MTFSAAAHTAEDPFAGLNLETHGFVSFGYLKSWGNNWRGETLEGTDEFYEAAANVIARPIDRLRLGAQLFVRDLGIYGNGQVELDWAYADWRANSALGVQVGRVKLPHGLYGESVDVDAGRASVFLPHMYASTLRDVLLSTDGVKAYGRLDDFDWALCAGNRQLQSDGDTATNFGVVAKLSDIDHVQTDLLLVGMLNWQTPLQGLTLRTTCEWLQGLEVKGTSAVAPLVVELAIPDLYSGAASLLYDHGDWTWAFEYNRIYAQRTITFTPTAGGPSSQSHSTFRDDMAYLSCTWHVRPWCDLYAAGEGVWSDPADRHGNTYEEALVGAINLMPTPHWSIKAEFRLAHGIHSVEAQLNPAGREDSWQLLALKTTVDF